MAVTDLSGGLPWWLQQGQAPSAAPGQSGMGWLNYLGQMFAPNPNAPSPNAAPMSMLNSGVGAASDGFPIPPADPNQNPNSIQARARAIQNPPPPPPQTRPALPTDAAPPPAAANAPIAPPAPMPARPVTPTPSPIGNRITMGPAGPPDVAALPDLTGIPRVNGVLATNAAGSAPAPAASPAAAPAAAAPAGPLSASGGAAGVGATSNPRFTGVPIQYQVPGSARSGPNAPVYTAMDLSGLFGRGQPAAAPAATPRAPGPLISKTTGKPMPMSNLPSLYNYPTWPSGGASALNPQAADIARARMLTPNYYGS